MQRSMYTMISPILSTLLLLRGTVSSVRQHARYDVLAESIFEFHRPFPTFQRLISSNFFPQFTLSQTSQTRWLLLQLKTTKSRRKLWNVNIHDIGRNQHYIAYSRRKGFRSCLNISHLSFIVSEKNQSHHILALRRFYQRIYFDHISIQRIF